VIYWYTDVVNRYRYPVRLCCDLRFRCWICQIFLFFHLNVCFQNNDKTSNLSELNESLTISTSDNAINVLFLITWKTNSQKMLFCCFSLIWSLLLCFNIKIRQLKMDFLKEEKNVKLTKNQYSRKSEKSLVKFLIFLLFLT